VEVAIKLIIQVAIMVHPLMEIAAVVLLITPQLITAQKSATALATVILYATALPYATIL
jgi:hypothetical protein